jgi:hypothetical protein
MDEDEFFFGIINILFGILTNLAGMIENQIGIKVISKRGGQGFLPTGWSPVVGNSLSRFTSQIYRNQLPN